MASSAFQTPPRYGTGSSAMTGAAASTTGAADHRRLLESLMAEMQEDESLDAPKTPDLHFSWDKVERKRSAAQGGTTTPMTRRASDGVVGTQTPAKAVLADGMARLNTSTTYTSADAAGLKRTTPPSGGSLTGSIYSTRSHLSSSASATSTRGLTDASTTTSSVLATTPPSSAEPTDAQLGLGRKTYGLTGAGDRKFSNRRFERVVSAPLSGPLERERERQRDPYDVPALTDRLASSSTASRPPLHHTHSTASTASVPSPTVDSATTSTARERDRDMSTPAATTRTLNSSTLNMSTGRRPGGLARFGGPARRRQEFVVQEEEDGQGGVPALGQNTERGISPDRSNARVSPTSSATRSVTPPRGSPPLSHSSSASTSSRPHQPTRISPSSLARYGSLPATIQEQEDEGHQEADRSALDRRLDLLRSKNAMSTSPESVMSAAGSSGGDRIGRHRVSPSLPSASIPDSHRDDRYAQDARRHQHMASSSTSAAIPERARWSGDNTDRPPPQPLQPQHHRYASPETQFADSQSATARPGQPPADLNLYHTPNRDPMASYAAASLPVAGPSMLAPAYTTMMQPVTAPAQPVPVINKRSFAVNGTVYDRLSILGRGGTSKVYSVLCPTKHTVYALKKVALDKADDETLRSYLNEIDLLKRMKGHDRVIQLIDHEISFSQTTMKPKTLQMLMECGETDFSNLLEEQRGKPLNMNFVGLYWQQMLQAVMAVHEQNVVHTDLKPANFVLVKGRLKIIDFGIAKAIANDTVNIHRDQQIGTVNYMSPEAIQRENGQTKLKLSYPSDVWSLGCILYQMVYGQCPFAHVAGGPLVRMNHIANPNSKIAFPTVAISRTAVDPDGKPIDPTDLSVPVREAAIDSMKGCLTYNKDERLTIPDLLEHDFLQPPSDRKQLPRNTTTITLTQMQQLINHIKTSVGEPVDAEGLFAELRAQNGSTV